MAPPRPHRATVYPWVKITVQGWAIDGPSAKVDSLYEQYASPVGCHAAHRGVLRFNWEKRPFLFAKTALFCQLKLAMARSQKANYASGGPKH